MFGSELIKVFAPTNDNEFFHILPLIGQPLGVSPDAAALGVFLYAMPDAGQSTPERLRVLSDSTDDDANLGQALLAVASRSQGYNGASWDRLRAISSAVLNTRTGVGAALTSNPGEWAIEHRPAAAAQATISRAAAGVGIRHVCKSITVSLVATANQTVLDAVLRDGATGAGAVLWSGRLAATAGLSRDITLSGLNIVGSENTAMTLEFTAAPAATNLEGVALTGYDSGAAA